MLIITLIVAGLILISAELLVPGGILGVVGGLCLLAACYFTFVDYGPMAAAALLVGSCFLIGVVIYAQFKLLRKFRHGGGIFLDASSGGGSLEERSARAIPDDIIGKQGECLTTLAPTGKVLIDGKPYEASLQNGLLRKGHAIEVVSRDAFRLIVKSV